MELFMYNGVIFDDVSEDDDGHHWSQVCKKCAKKRIEDWVDLDVDAGNGICGVAGCNRDADHYIDFREIYLKKFKEVV